MSSDGSRIEPLEPSQSARIQRQEQIDAQMKEIILEASEDAFTEWSDEAAFNPVMMARRFESLEEKKKKQRDESQKTEEKKVVQIQKLEEVSDEYSKRNPELHSRALLTLRGRISTKDSPEDILKKVLETYPHDYSLADEALDFLLDTSDGDLAALIRKAKENFHAAHGREIRAGRNIGAQAREYASQALGTPTNLRDLYREITGNPREASSLFSELSEKYPFNSMKSLINFILHALGADLKSKGPSIAHAELHRLMTEARNLQAILWVYRFFQSRMKLIENSLHRNGLLLPSKLTFELIAKQFVQLLMERYPSMDKVLQMALKLGISAETIMQIIIYTQMRDAVRGVAPKMFRSEQHRHDVLMSFIEALEELEERQQEEEDEEDEEKKDEEKKDD